MSDDIVKRLRKAHERGTATEYVLFHYAADEIERLRAELASEREKRKELADYNLQLQSFKGIEDRAWEKLTAERDALRADLAAYQKERDEEVARLRAERDELRAILLEARVYVECRQGPLVGYLLARIDAALNKGGSDE